MADYYVSQAGGGDGSAWDNAISIAQFNSTAAAGNTYYLIGTITTSLNCPSGTAGNHVEIRGDYAGHPGHLNVAAGYAMQCTGGERNYYTVRNLEMTMASATGAVIGTNGHDYTITGCTINTANVGISFSSTRSAINIIITDNIINGGAAASGDAIIWNAASDTYDCTGLVITGNTITDAGRHGINIGNTLSNGCDDWNISDNTITGSVNAGIRINGGIPQESYTGGFVSNVLISNNTITGNAGGMGIYAISGEISGNTISENVSVTGGLDLFWSDNVLITRNTCSNNVTAGSLIDGNGILIDYGCSNITVSYNTCNGNLGDSGNNNSGCGIMLLGGLATQTSDTITVMNNVGTGNRHGIFCASLYLTNVVLANNTFTDCVESGIVVENNVGLNAMTFYNNICTGSVGYGVDDYINGNAQIHSHNILFGWASVYHNMIIDGTELTADPQLDHNYAPQGDSPCIGAGVPPLSLTDYNGDTRKSLAGFDIGAIWFDGPSDTTVERLLASGGTK